MSARSFRETALREQQIAARGMDRCVNTVDRAGLFDPLAGGFNPQFRKRGLHQTVAPLRGTVFGLRFPC